MFQRKVIDYFLVSMDGYKKFSNEVNSYLKKGYELYGFPYKIDGFHYQAVVLYDDSVDGDENDSE